MTRVLGERWAVPTLDAHTRAFFTSGVLALQRCRRCAYIQHPPEDVCASCQGFDFDHFASAGIGRVESVAVVTQAVHPLLAEQVPYAIALVAVADAPGVLIAGNVVGREPDAVRIGDRVRVVFEDATDPHSGEALTIPQWVVTDA